ncbi:MAG: lamin tail domain-containing protein, partial [Verrucomicrobiota bacterium]
MPQLTRLFENNDITHQYYRELNDLIETSFSGERFDTLIDRLWGDWVDSEILEDARAFNVARREDVLDQIGRPLSLDKGLSFDRGYAELQANRSYSLSGRYPGTHVTAILINGNEATLNARKTSWSYDLKSEALPNGLSSLTIESLQPDGTTHDKLEVPLFLATREKTLSGTLSSDQTIGPDEGLWLLTSDVRVNAGRRLTVLPGTNLLFRPGTRLIIETGAELRANGTPENPVYFARQPGQRTGGAGLLFEGGETEHLLRNVIFNEAGPVVARDGALRVTECHWLEAEAPLLRLTDTSLKLENSTLQGTGSEALIQIDGIPDPGVAMQGNQFGPADRAISANGRPGDPWLRATDNHFSRVTEAVFTCADLSLFSEANHYGAVTGEAHRLSGTSEAYIVRNRFDHVDRILTLSGNSRGVLSCNNIHHSSSEPFTFTDLRRTTGHRPLVLEKNVFHPPFRPYHDLLFESLDALHPGLPDCGLAGSETDEWASLFPALPDEGGERIHLHVWGPAIVDYRFRLSGTPFSPPLPITEPITINRGQLPFRLEVISRKVTGQWQPESAPLVFESLPSDTRTRNIRLSEIQAAESSRTGDFIELQNTSTETLSLEGFRLTDNPYNRFKYTFPFGTELYPGEFLVLNSGPTNGFQIPFSLDRDGEGVYLFDREGALVDFVVFGRQLPGLTIGRTHPDGEWTLNRPTPGFPNLSQLLGSTETLRINEFTGAHAVMHSEDLIELWNPLPLPVDLGGHFLTDAPDYKDPQHQFPPHTFLAREEFGVFEASDDTVDPLNAGDPPISRDTSRLGFALSSLSDWIVLADSDGQPIDYLSHSTQMNDRASARVPDGIGPFHLTSSPSFGRSNESSESHLNQLLLQYLRITELMYHPATDGKAEYVELQNISDTHTLNLKGTRFSDGVEYLFPDLPLAPGETIYIVADQNKFNRVYGFDHKVAGQYNGKLANGGERIALTLPAPSYRNILRFSYDDGWFPSTDGSGFSLQIRDPGTPPTDWSNASTWLASTRPGGSVVTGQAFDFAAWLGLHGLENADPDQDPDNDGWPLLTEYAFSLNPLSFDQLDWSVQFYED